MSGVLSRLAQRALGATSLRPRLGGTFEPAPPEDTLSEAPAPPLPFSTPATPAAPWKQAGMREELPVSNIPEEPVALPGRPLTPRPRSASPRRLPPAVAPMQHPLATPAVEAVKPMPPADAPQPTPATPPLPRPMLPPVAESLLPPAPVAVRRPPPEAQPPDITISIGSIEFRAPPQPRQVSVAASPAPRLMSLEDYLARGQRGRR